MKDWAVVAGIVMVSLVGWGAVLVDDMAWEEEGCFLGGGRLIGLAKRWLLQLVRLYRAFESRVRCLVVTVIGLGVYWAWVDAALL